MSMCYWMNEGVGVRASKIYPHLDKHKCFIAVFNQLPDEEIEEDDFDIVRPEADIRKIDACLYNKYRDCMESDNRWQEAV